MREIETQKAVLAETVASLLKIRQRAAFLSNEAAAVYRSARARGLNRKIVREIVNDLGSDTSPETIWKLYSDRAGIGPS